MGEGRIGPTGAACRLAVVALAVAVAVGLGASTTAGQQEGTVVGRPALEIVASNNTVTLGESTVELVVINDAVLDRGGPADLEQRVQTARNVRLSVAEDRLDPVLAAGLDVESGVVPVGTVPPGVVGPFRLQVDVNRSLSPGTYELPIRLEYEYTAIATFGPFSDPAYVDREVSRIVRVPLVVEGRPELRLQPVPNQSVSPGAVTSFEIRVENVGTAVARDVGLVLRTDNATIYFRDTERPRGVVQLFVPRLRPGETRTVSVPLAADFTTPDGRYLVQGTATYRTSRGRVTQHDIAFGVRVDGGSPRNSTANDDLPATRRGPTVGSRPVATGRPRVATTDVQPA